MHTEKKDKIAQYFGYSHIITQLPQKQFGTIYFETRIQIHMSFFLRQGTGCNLYEQKLNVFLHSNYAK